MDAISRLERARAAYDARTWGEAYALFSGADAETRLGGEDLWRLAMAAYLTGREDEAISHLERAHHAHRDAGATTRAAACAFWIGFLLANRGEMGPASGWHGRARRLVEQHGEACVEEGYLLLPAALRHVGAGDYQAAHDAAAEAATIAQRFRDGDLLAMALHIQGRALVRQARVDEGLALLDEAMVAVASDELSPPVTGMIYCSVISACRDVYAVGRAREWTAALSDWCERQPELVAYTGQCRVHRAEIMQLRGAWKDAAREAHQAAVRAGHDTTTTAPAMVQQGDVHRLLGEFGAAEEAYRNASRLGREPQPGLALLRLAQGDLDAAAAAIRRALGEAREALRRARLLPAFVEIMLAIGDPDEAEPACQELTATAAAVGTDYLRAAAARARGAVDLARGDASTALASLRAAHEAWQELDAPYEDARTRELIALACRELGDEDSAALETEAARAAFEALCAAPDLERLERAARDRSGAAGAARDTHGLTPRELEVLAELATGKTNRAIAGALFISEKTVARHVSNIFAKLDLSSRAAATAFAYEHGLADPPA